jgi:hypothetical protein
MNYRKLHNDLYTQLQFCFPKACSHSNGRWTKYGSDGSGGSDINVTSFTLDEYYLHSLGNRINEYYNKCKLYFPETTFSTNDDSEKSIEILKYVLPYLGMNLIETENYELRKRDKPKGYGYIDKLLFSNKGACYDDLCLHIDREHFGADWDFNFTFLLDMKYNNNPIICEINCVINEELDVPGSEKFIRTETRFCKSERYSGYYPCSKYYQFEIKSIRYKDLSENIDNELELYINKIYSLDELFEFYDKHNHIVVVNEKKYFLIEESLYKKFKNKELKWGDKHITEHLIIGEKFYKNLKKKKVEWKKHIIKNEEHLKKFYSLAFIDSMVGSMVESMELSNLIETDFSFIRQNLDWDLFIWMYLMFKKFLPGLIIPGIRKRYSMSYDNIEEIQNHFLYRVMQYILGLHGLTIHTPQKYIYTYNLSTRERTERHISEDEIIPRVKKNSGVEQSVYYKFRISKIES